MQAPDGSISVLLVEDHELMRYGLKSLLKSIPGITVVAETDSGSVAVELADKLRPNLVLMDLRLAASDGISSTKRIKQVSPGTMVLAFTSFDDREHLLDAMSAGADGYCLKTSTSQDLVTAILTVVGGEPWLDPVLAGELYQNYAAFDTKRAGETQCPVTPRELEILKLIVHGCTNPQIAKELVVSIETVKTHIKHILEKLSASDRTQAAVEAMKRGLL